ncbi:hypothetical protein BHM03_00057067 [Ensete ventricosum]|uniref:Uncharacterized protein n=1 Tax=Ensete ventricosum TaxID=4639 RepID=A0A445MMH0_ENSVE|nr:hypothetical protein BHM03_00057067 [Ensete ventricosum]
MAVGKNGRTDDGRKWLGGPGGCGKKSVGCLVQATETHSGSRLVKATEMVLLKLVTNRMLSNMKVCHVNAGVVLEERNRLLRMDDTAIRGEVEGREKVLLYGGASGRAADLAQVRPNPQRSYDRPDTGKADTLTCRRMPHRKDGGRGGGVRWHGKPQGQPGYQPILVTGYEGSIHLAKHRPRPEPTAGELAHKGLNQQCSLSGYGGRPNPLGRHQILP